MDVFSSDASDDCLSRAEATARVFNSQAEDILTDDDLLDLFRIMRQILKKRPDTERVAKLLFCIAYALGDHVKFCKSLHDDRIVFRDDINPSFGIVALPLNSSCCPGRTEVPRNGFHHDNGSINSQQQIPATEPPPPPQQQQQQQHPYRWFSSQPLTRLLPSPDIPDASEENDPSTLTGSEEDTRDLSTVHPYAHLRPLYPTATGNDNVLGGPSSPSPSSSNVREQTPFPRRLSSTTLLGVALAKQSGNNISNGTSNQPRREVLMEPKQRGFYYQDGRIGREPPQLQRFAEQGVLTQASLMRKRKRKYVDGTLQYELTTLPAPAKKPKIPHRHGEFEQRRKWVGWEIVCDGGNEYSFIENAGDDIISRMRSITVSDLEQKASRLPSDFTLAIEQAPIPEEDLSRTPEEAASLLEPALRILTYHSNMKPHLDNGMNQNGIYYNADYFRLFLAFEQFQKVFARLFPNEVVNITKDGGEDEGNNINQERDKDRERNANMKAYRGWIEPLLTETNWAAFRRNIVVGERMMQLTKVVGQGVLLMTKELSGSKLHLTFTNNEWEEFINGLSSGKWDHTIKWESEPSADRSMAGDGASMLVTELQLKFGTRHWFRPDGTMTKEDERRRSLRSSRARIPPDNNDGPQDRDER